MKKNFLLGLLSVTALSVTSNVMASDITKMLKQAFPQSMFTSKCSSGNAKIDWDKVAAIEQLGGADVIRKKISERVTPCLEGNNSNYQSKFKKNCASASAPSNAKSQLCGGGGGQQQQQGQGNSFGEGQQKPVMGTPIQGQGNIQDLEQNVQKMMQYLIQELAPFIQQQGEKIQQLDERIQQLESQQQGGGGQQFGGGGQQFGGGGQQFGGGGQQFGVGGQQFGGGGQQFGGGGQQGW